MWQTMRIPTPCLVVPTGPYVLLVDDHTPSLRRLHDVVKLAGHRCAAFGSATTALSACETRRPQVVVTDLVMPNLDGCGLARWLKSRYPSVPILLVTGEPLDAALRSELLQTFTAVFPKPLT